METNMIPKAGSRWTSQNGYIIFRVLHIVELDGHTWVHYCNEDDGEKKYSCYVESFLERFSETVNN
jgi:hypothetical protein